MPELPEVESLRRDLAPTLVGRTIRQVELRLPKLFKAEPGLDVDTLVDKQVRGLERRAKLLVMRLSDDLVLVTHLRLTGQLVHVGPGGESLAHGGHPVPAWGTELPHKSTHLTFYLDDRSILYLTDIRQFSRLWLMRSEEIDHFLAAAKFGPEPLEDAFTPVGFEARLSRRGVPIKTVLLDQRVIGGVGNIYADESLWEAGIHPLRPAASLNPDEVGRLHAAVRKVLDYAVREGVAFVPMGKAISDRAFPYCHGRQGSPCARCGSLIEKARVGGRGTYWCATCQTAAG